MSLALVLPWEGPAYAGDGAHSYRPASDPMLDRCDPERSTSLFRVLPARKLHMQTSRLIRVGAASLIGSIVLASSACSVEGVAPTSNVRAVTPTAQPLATLTDIGQSEESLSLPDGVYTFAVDPRVDQVLALGKSRVVLPAGSVCALGVSGYGPTMWDKGCNPQKKPFSIIVTVAGAGTEDAAIDFQPAMRFNPLKTVTMDFHVPELSATSSFAWTIFYCPTPSGQPGARLGTNLMRADPTCVDESLDDSSLAVVPDYQNSVLTRRLKHFSAYQLFRGGYTVAE
jgi:hypothetical protein